MSAPLMCRCGEVIVRGATPAGVVTTDGLTVAFRRHTDYVLCPTCFSFYRTLDLGQGRVQPLTLSEIRFLQSLESAADAGEVAHAV